MMLKIPQELQKYVRMSKKEGLIHSDNMPAELIPLFEETKETVIKAEKKRRSELEALITAIKVLGYPVDGLVIANDDTAFTKNLTGTEQQVEGCIRDRSCIIVDKNKEFEKE